MVTDDVDNEMTSGSGSAEVVDLAGVGEDRALPTVTRVDAPRRSRVRGRLARPRVATIRRGASRVVAMVLGGALVGYVTAAIVGSFVIGGALTGRPAEPTVTRQYISAMLDRDASRLASLQPATDIGSRAAAVQQAANQDRFTPEAITYLGGATEGPVGVYVYVVKVKSADGKLEESIPFAFTVLQQKVVRVQ